MPKTLSIDVLSRFLDDKEISDLLAEYKSSLKSIVSRNRVDALTATLTPEDIILVKEFFFSDTSLADLAKKYEVTQAVYRGRVHKAAYKLVYQNKDKLGL